MSKLLRQFVIAFTVDLAIRAAIGLYLFFQERKLEEEFQDYHPIDDYDEDFAEDIDDEPDEEAEEAAVDAFNAMQYGTVSFFEPQFSGSDVDELVEAQDAPTYPLTVAPEPMPHLSFAPYLEEEDDGDHPA